MGYIVSFILGEAAMLVAVCMCKASKRGDSQ